MRTATSLVAGTSGRREHLAPIEEARAALFGDHRPADTVIGVEALSHPDYLIEIEAIAVI
jgi:enamine deaminase RidA (YjgF/YER057c/UK114 family)